MNSYEEQVLAMFPKAEYVTAWTVHLKLNISWSTARDLLVSMAQRSLLIHSHGVLTDRYALPEKEAN